MSYSTAALMGYGNYTDAALEGYGNYSDAALEGGLAVGGACPGSGIIKSKKRSNTLVKGSPEAKARMAYLRSLRGKKKKGGMSLYDFKRKEKKRKEREYYNPFWDKPMRLGSSRGGRYIEMTPERREEIRRKLQEYYIRHKPKSGGKIIQVLDSYYEKEKQPPHEQVAQSFGNDKNERMREEFKRILEEMRHIPENERKEWLKEHKSLVDFIIPTNKDLKKGGKSALTGNGVLGNIWKILKWSLKKWINYGKEWKNEKDYYDKEMKRLKGGKIYWQDTRDVMYNPIVGAIRVARRKKRFKELNEARKKKGEREMSYEEFLRMNGLSTKSFF